MKTSLRLIVALAGLGFAACPGETQMQMAGGGDAVGGGSAGGVSGGSSVGGGSAAGGGGGSATGGGAANQPPVAVAGSDQMVFSAAVVTLDGTASSDPDGDALTSTWTQTGGSPQVTLTVTAPGKATFTAATVTSASTLVFKLTVSDGQAQATASTSVTINPVTAGNHPPVASLTAAPSVASAAVVTLDASGSSDPDGDSLTYVFAQTLGPTVGLTGIDTPTPTFVAPTVTVSTALRFTVTVDDGHGATSVATANVTVLPASSNHAPVVTAGATQTVTSAAAVTLHGTATDADGDAMTSVWTQTAGPTVTLASPTALQPTFTAPTVAATTALHFSLVATDSHGLASTPATAVVNVNPGTVVTASLTKQVSLHAVTRTSIVVFFMTNVAVAATVDYGVAGTENTKTEASAVTRHVITLSGLTQDTAYKYTVHAGTATASGGFQTAMDYATNPKPFTFAVVGDARGHADWVTVSNSIKAKNPRFFIQTGDNNDAAGSAANWEDYYLSGKALFANVPVFSAQGNHDTGSNYSVYNISPQSSSGSDLYYAAVYGNVGMVALNTNSLSTAQLTWAKNAMNTLSGGPLFTFHHHPLYSCGSHGSDTGLQGSLKTAFETAKVTTDVTGHDHDLIFWSTINTVRYVVSGGGGTGHYALSGCQGPFSSTSFGFMLVNVNGASVTETIYDQNGAQLYANPAFNAAGAAVPFSALGTLVTY